MTIRAAVLEQIEIVAKQQSKTLGPLTDEVALMETGLDSLCIAILVANLDDELELDPFGGGSAVRVPATLGDFIRLYEDKAAENHAA